MSSGKHLILIDNEVEFCRIAKNFFNDHEYAITVTHSIADSIRAGKDKDPDVILLNSILIKTDSVACVSKIRSEGVTAPIILLNSEINPSAETMYPPGTFYAVLQKPFYMQELLKLINMI